MRIPIVTILIAVLLASCAQINPLTGGENDQNAPKIDSTKTVPRNGQLNFTEQEVNIRFDEFISLSNPNENIILTPQQKTKPEITSKNKNLRIKFQEPLLPNTTYSIAFNRAITDITEQNDSIFQYVFSTGDYIDSLSIQGKLTDGFTNEGKEGFLVALYPADSAYIADSIAYKIKPTYIAQSDKRGVFRLNYLKEGNYYLFAIRDDNRNLKLEPSEELGFYSIEPIRLDSVMSKVEIKTFRQQTGECELRNKEFTYPGRVKMTFMNEPDTFSISTSIPLLQEDTEQGDSLIYWLRSNPTAKMEFYTQLNGELDTLKMIYKGVPDSKASRALKVENNVKGGKLLPEERLRISFSEPIDSFSTDVIEVTKDSIPVEWTYKIDNLRHLEITPSDTGQMEIQIDSLGITSWFGNQNEETIRIIFENRDQDYYGTLIVNLDSLTEETMLVELINTKGELVRKVTYGQQMIFEDLEPLDYQIRMIFDTNGDGEWTGGSLKDGRIPERVIYYSGNMKVKSRWEKEIDWNIKY